MNKQMAHCLRCGAGPEWIEGKVLAEDSADSQLDAANAKIAELTVANEQHVKWFESTDDEKTRLLLAESRSNEIVTTMLRAKIAAMEADVRTLRRDVFDPDIYRIVSRVIDSLPAIGGVK